MTDVSPGFSDENSRRRTRGQLNGLVEIFSDQYVWTLPVLRGEVGAEDPRGLDFPSAITRWVTAHRTTIP